MTVAGKQNRSFSAKYLKEYSWLEYSLEKNAIFCFCCQNFGCGDVDKVGFGELRPKKKMLIHR